MNEVIDQSATTTPAEIDADTFFGEPVGDGVPKPAEPEQATQEAKPEDKPSDTAVVDPKTQAPDPSEIKLNLPENHVVEKSRADELANFAKENKLTPEIAQKILDQENEMVSRLIKAGEESNQRVIDSWVNEIKADTEIGGDNFKESVAHASNLVKKYGSEKFIKELNDSGYGNHPELVRLFARIGKEMAPDKLVHGRTTAPQPKSREDYFYS